MSVLKGFDTTANLTDRAVELKQTLGYDFVLRYYSHNSAKNLAPAEARALAAAQLQIGVVWESAGTHASFFSREQGLADGAAAFQMASATIGQPRDSAIYFAVDYDATQADLDGPVSAYFGGVRDAFAQAATDGQPYLVGVYGSGLACSCLLEAGLAKFGWLSQSTGFTGSGNFKAQGLYNLLQDMPLTITFADGSKMQIDPDVSNATRPAGMFTL
jgi:hypothetical protein